MATVQTELKSTILASGFMFPESLRWHKGKLWFSDIYGQTVYNVDTKGHATVVAKVPERPTGLGFLPDGTLLIAARGDKKVYRLGPDGLHVRADFTKTLGTRLDDMVVDTKGRAYVNRRQWPGPTGEHQPGYLAMLEPNGPIRMVADGLMNPNGMVITPDGKTLIVAEAAHRLTAYDIEADGWLSKRRVWANLGVLTADGICLDAEMGIWIGTGTTGGFARVLEGGKITDRFNVPGKWCIMPMLGGEDGKTLYLSTVQTTLADCRGFENMFPGPGTPTSVAWIEQVRVSIPHAGLP